MAEYFHDRKDYLNISTAKHLLTNISRSKRHMSLLKQGSGFIQNQSNEHQPATSGFEDFQFFPASIDLSKKEFWPLSRQPVFESEFATKLSFLLFANCRKSTVRFLKTDFLNDMYGIKIDSFIQIKSKKFAYITRMIVSLRIVSNSMNITRVMNLRSAFELICDESDSKKIIEYMVRFHLVARPTRRNMILMSSFYNLVFPMGAKTVTDSPQSNNKILDTRFRGLLSFKDTHQINLRPILTYDYKGDHLFTNLIHLQDRFIARGFFIETTDKPFSVLGWSPY